MIKTDNADSKLRLVLGRGQGDFALRHGNLAVGEKLKGAFALTHTRMGGDDANWLLVKVDDEYADRRRVPTATENESVLSGKTNEDFEVDQSG